MSDRAAVLSNDNNTRSEAPATTTRSELAPPASRTENSSSPRGEGEADAADTRCSPPAGGQSREPGWVAAAIAAREAGDGNDTACAHCGVAQPESAFSNKQRRHDGLQRGTARCRSCVAEACGGRAASKPLPPFERSSRAPTADARAAAFATWRRRRAAATAKRDAAAATTAKTTSTEPPVFFRARHEPPRPDNDYSLLSLTSAAPFVDSMRRSFCNVDHFLAHRRCTTFGDDALAARVLAEPDPDRARALGARVHNYDEATWVKYRETWCEDGIWRTCKVHPELAAVLLGTGERELVACGADDDVWAVGMDVDEARNASATARGAGNNNNLLGRCLGRVRVRLQRQERRLAHTGVVPWCCSEAEGGLDYDAIADLLELYQAVVPIQDRAVVCSRSRATWQDPELITMLRRFRTTGGVPASPEALAALAACTEDKYFGGNGKLSVEDTLTALDLLGNEFEKGWALKFQTREEMRDAGYPVAFFHGVFLAAKKKDGSPKLQVKADLIGGNLRDGVHNPLMPAARWIDHDSKESSPGAGDSLNHLSPIEGITLDDVPYAAEVAMALMSNDGELSGDELREIEGSTVDIEAAYRILSLSQRARPLHCFRFLDPDKPVPQYVLDGEQPREADMIYALKATMPFGWTWSVKHYIAFSKGLKALYLWDENPALKLRVPRGPGGERQYDATVYFDDAGLYAVRGLGELAQRRYLELLDHGRVPASMKKLRAEGAVSQRLAMLGVIFDFAERELQMSAERLAVLKRRCEEMGDKPYSNRADFDSLVGVLSYVCSCVQGGRTFMDAFYAAQRGRGRYVRHNRSIKVALAWFCRFMVSWNGKSMMLDDYETTCEEQGIFPDASLEGFGATLVRDDGTAEYFGGLWSDVLPGIDTSQALGEWHVSELEALVFLMCMHQWSGEFRGKRIVGRCDNESTVTAVNAMKCSDPGMHTCVKELWYLKMERSFDIRLRHLRTADNVLGDCPSRWNRADGSRDPRYEAEFFEFAESVFGLQPSDMTEVEPTFDVRGMLQRMGKAHRGRRHRLNAEQ